MMILDIILLVIIAGFALHGFASGFVNTVSSLIGSVFSIVVAINVYMSVTFWLLPDAFAGRFWVQMVVFFMVFSVMSKIMHLLVDVIEKAFNVVAIIPFTKTINRILGVLVGLVEGVLVAGALVYMLVHLPSLPETIQSAVDDSFIAGTLMFISTAMTFLFPGAIERAQDMFTEATKNS